MVTLNLYITTVEGGAIAAASVETRFDISDDMISTSEWAIFSGRAPEDGIAAVWDQTSKGNSFRDGLLYTTEPVGDDAALRVTLDALGERALRNARENVFCFLRGTLIRTPEGDVPIEGLSVGDLVETLDSGPQPLRWIGHSLNFRQRHRPVRIMAGALGEGRPFRDLYVSPDHRVVIGGWKAEVLFGKEEVLTSARHLIDGEGIRRIRKPMLAEYYHLLFDQHQIVTSNGLLSESFHPGEPSMDKAEDAVREEVFAIFPELRDDMAAFGQLSRTVVSAREARALLS